MSYRLINANDLAMKYPEVNDMPCIYADLPNGLDGTHHYLASPVQPEAKWIPVSKRVPEESLNSVIGWDRYRERCVFVQYIDGHFQNRGNTESFDIVAWMPLPEPYKAESEVEE